MRSTSLLIVLLALSGCSTSQEQGPYGPHLDSIVEVNRALQGYALMGVDDVPMLVGPQR